MMTSQSAVLAQRDAFAATTPRLREPDWLASRRAGAMQHFVERGLPTHRLEAWRFCDLRLLVAGLGLPLPAREEARPLPALAAHRLPGTAHRIVLLNGRFAPELSQIGALPRGVWLGSLADCIDLRPDLAAAAFDVSDTQGEQSFASLNAAFCADGFALLLDPGVVLEQPVEVLHVNDAAGPHACHLRSVILAEAGSVASVVETYVGSGAGWTNAVTTIHVGVGATLRHVKVQAESAEAVHLALVRADLAATAHYEGFVLVVGARQSRHEVQAQLTGADTTMVLNGAYLLRGEQEATIAPVVDHCCKGGQTSELIKGVITDRAHGVFLGTMVVREGADGTDARQLNPNLMLSPGARVDTRPELTIHADEVKCSHGATVGDLDEAALFYLVSRGIDPLTARHMLVEAFAADVFDVAALAPGIDAHARRYLLAWLAREGERS